MKTGKLVFVFFVLENTVISRAESCDSDLTDSFFAEHRGLARSRYSYGTLLSATEGSKLPGKRLQGRDRCLAQEADVTQVNIAVDDRQRLATQM